MTYGYWPVFFPEFTTFTTAGNWAAFIGENLGALDQRLGTIDAYDWITKNDLDSKSWKK